MKKSFWKPRKIIGGLLGPLAPGARPTTTALAAALLAAAVSSAATARPAEPVPRGPLEDIACELRQTGCEEWVARYRGPGESWNSPMDVTTSPDGARAYVTGFSMGDGTGYDFATLAYATEDGSLAWAARSSGEGETTDIARGVAVAPDGARVFVTGAGSRPGTGLDAMTVAYDASSGVPLWQALFDRAGAYDDAAVLAVSPGGDRVYVAGRATAEGGSDYLLLAYEAETGELVWERLYDGPGGAADAVSAIALDPAGTRIFVTGASAGEATGFDVATIAYRASDGRHLWTSRHEGGGGQTSETADSLVVAEDGEALFIAGGAQGNGMDALVMALDTEDGEQLWLDWYDGPASWNDRAVASVIHGSTLYVAGDSMAPVSFPNDGIALDFLTIAYDTETGARRWVRLWNAPSDNADLARAVGITPDGREVLVVGESRYVIPGTLAVSRMDFATVAYDAETGQQRWWARYEHTGIPYYQRPLPEFPVGSWNVEPHLAIAPDGAHAILTGSSLGADDRYDYVTMAYPLVRVGTGPPVFRSLPRAWGLDHRTSNVIRTGRPEMRPSGH